MHRRMDRRAVARGAGALAGAAAVGEPLAAAAAAGDTADGTPEATEASLYDRLGGIFAIAAVVDRFSDAIVENPKLNENPALKAWNEDEAPTRLPGLKVMRTVWVAALAGGPFEYTGKPLDEAHADLDLTAEEFAEVGAEIVRALEHFGVPEREIQELVDAYMTSMDEVVSAE